VLPPLQWSQTLSPHQPNSSPRSYLSTRLVADQWLMLLYIVHVHCSESFVIYFSVFPQKKGNLKLWSNTTLFRFENAYWVYVRLTNHKK